MHKNVIMAKDGIPLAFSHGICNKRDSSFRIFTQAMYFMPMQPTLPDSIEIGRI